MLLSLVVLAAIAWYITTPAERERAVRVAAHAVARAPGIRTVAKMFRRERDELLEQMLRERTPWPLVTMVIAVLNVALFVWMRADPAAPLVESLANFGPKTTNGEWWRLLTATFVHANVFSLLINVAAVVQVGLVLERLVGSLTFAAVYLVAAVFASLAALSGAEFNTIMGASGAVFGIYGLLIATWMWGTLQQAESTLRLRIVKAFAPVAAVFSVVNLSAGPMAANAECLGLAIGFTCGVLMARSVRVSKPPVRRVATIAAASAYIAVVAIVPLRGLSDPRPVLASVFAAETRTVADYDAALKDFRNGHIDRHELAQIIDRKVLPQLQSLRLELQTLERPPREQVPLVRAAEIYTLRRIESWKIRAHALRNGNSRSLRHAEEVERAALDRLGKIR